MNVQLASDPRMPRSLKVERRQTIAAPRAAALARHPGLTSEQEHKILVVAFFSFLAGWIISNAGWSTSAVGYPLMVLGLLLPLVPAYAQLRSIRRANQTRRAIVALEAQGKGRTGRGLVYELHSRDYP